MTLGERCDEIVRLIDETLRSVGRSTSGGTAVTPVTEPVPARGDTAVPHRQEGPPVSLL